MTDKELAHPDAKAIVQFVRKDLRVEMHDASWKQFADFADAAVKHAVERALRKHRAEVLREAAQYLWDNRVGREEYGHAKHAVVIDAQELERLAAEAEEGNRG